MFSIRRVASVVPIPQRGEQGPGGVQRVFMSNSTRSHRPKVSHIAALQEHVFWPVC